MRTHIKMAIIEWQKPRTKGNFPKHTSKPLKIRKQKLALHCLQPKSLTLLPQNRCYLTQLWIATSTSLDSFKFEPQAMMKSSRTHYKHVINMMNRYLYIILIYLYIICIVCMWISLCQWICLIVIVIASWSEKDEVPTCAVQRNRIGSPSLQYAWSRQRPSWCVACGGLRRDLKPLSKSIFLNA